MQVVVCGHCRASVAPRTDGTCPACTRPVDGASPAQPRTVELGRPDDPGAAARGADVRHLLLGAALLVGSFTGMWLSWIVLSVTGGFWLPLVLVAVVMLFLGVWEWWEVDRRLGQSAVLCVVAAGLGLPAGRGPIFFPIAAAAVVYAAHRIRTVVLRRRDTVPAARVHADDCP